jgi:hypothetical protein
MADDVLEFRLDGIEYKAKKFNAIEQINLYAKLAPLIFSGIAEILPFMQELRDASIAGGMAGAFGSLMDNKSIPEMLRRFGPAAQKLSEMKPEDISFVIDACMRRTSKKIGEGKYADLWGHTAGRVMDDRLNSDAWLTLRICGSVIWGSMGSFFSVSP